MAKQPFERVVDSDVLGVELERSLIGPDRVRRARQLAVVDLRGRDVELDRQRARAFFGGGGVGIGERVITTQLSGQRFELGTGPSGARIELECWATVGQ